MNYTREDFIRGIALYGGLDTKRITYLSFLVQYSIYNIGPINIAIKYTHDGQPITRNRFYIGYNSVIEMEYIPEPLDMIGPNNLPPNIKNRIVKIWYKHITKNTWQLAHLIRKKLRLEPVEKWRDYTGMDIDHYLHVEKFKIIKKEI